MGVTVVESVAGVVGVGVAADLEWLCFHIEGRRRS